MYGQQISSGLAPSTSTWSGSWKVPWWVGVFTDKASCKDMQRPLLGASASSGLAHMLEGGSFQSDESLSSINSMRPFAGARRASAAPSRFDRGDVDLAHLHHRVECTLGRRTVGIGQRVR